MINHVAKNTQTVKTVSLNKKTISCDRRSTIKRKGGLGIIVVVRRRLHVRRGEYVLGEGIHHIIHQSASTGADFEQAVEPSR
jgi:hypothetical protein